MFRDHPDENIHRKHIHLGETLKQCVSMRKAGRLRFCKALEDSLRSHKLHEYRNLCKGNHEKTQAIAQSGILPFTQHFLYKRCFHFYRKVLSLNCYFKVSKKLHRYKYFRATPVLCFIGLDTQSKALQCLFWDWHLTSPILPHVEPLIIFSSSSEENTSEANAEVILMYHSVLLSI